jgi:hypothetical protein
MINAYNIFIGKPEGKRPRGRSRSRWEVNIRMDLREKGSVMDWMPLAQDRDQCEHGNKPWGSIKGERFLD